MRYAIIILALLAAGCASSVSAPRPAGSMEPEPKTIVKSYGPWERTRGMFGADKPIDSVRRMEDSTSPDHRRQGIYELVKYDFGQTETYCRRYRQIAKDDPDFTVRAAAVRACNWARDPKAVPVFIAAMADPNELVRWEAAKGLSNVPDASAVDVLSRAVGNEAESKNVRIAAADALRHYRSLAAARALVATLNGKDFSLAWQSRRSLHTMTGSDLRYNERAWLEFLSGTQKPLG